ncbi:MAG: folylpolyglutamate synthase/dihydrofolate synthase family protein [Candidatus Methylomirabilales bacterium]
MTYRDATQYLFGLRRFGWRPGLASIERLLALLGDPHAGLPAVHVGGTNGKGSTAAILSAILRAAGLRTALYTSPHLASFTERIQVDGERIPEAEVARLTAELRARCAEHFGRPADPPHPTFFELTTAMAFLHFRQREAEVAVVEVGLGGRLDATNVLRPRAAVITNVSLEHEEYLGKTVAHIAREKAGIIKPETPVVSGAAGEALAVIRAVAAERRAPLVVLPERYAWTIRESTLAGQRFDLRGPVRAYGDLHLALLGRHQVENAVAAVAAAEILSDTGLPVTEAAVREGLRTAAWPGRLQIVNERPRLLLDGAHNPAGMETLVGFLRQHWAVLGRLVVVFGVLQDKNAPAMLDALLPLAAEVILTRPPSDRAAEPAALLGALDGRCPARVVPGVMEAVAAARAVAGPQDTVLITGSLYTVGAVLGGGAGGEQPSD